MACGGEGECEGGALRRRVRAVDDARDVRHDRALDLDQRSPLVLRPDQLRAPVPQVLAEQLVPLVVAGLQRRPGLRLRLRLRLRLGFMLRLRGAPSRHS